MDKKCITAFANAKINLHLEVSGKRSDGYHNISSVFQSVSLADKITVKAKNTSGITLITKNMVIEGENLAVKAAEVFFKQTGITASAEIELEKNIPLSAGLAGGSADAAAVLVCLNTLFSAPLTQSQLLELGVSLGADVPFCIMGGTVMAEGIGEKLSPLKPLEDFHVVLIKHHFKGSTGEMYGRLDNRDTIPSFSTEYIINAIEKGDPASAAPHLKNSFLDVSDDKPEQTLIINELKSAGAVLAGLSGSGPTVYGLFEKIEPFFLKGLKEKYREVYLCKTSKSGIKIIE